MRLPRPVRLFAPALLATLVLAGCGAEEAAPETAPETAEPATSAPAPAPSPSESPGPSPAETQSPEPAEPEGVVVDVAVAGDRISPNGERVLAELGEPVTFRIESDRAGELHVHSTPEQVIAFTAGTSEHELVIDQPGVVEVEEHDTDLVLVQLQVS